MPPYRARAGSGLFGTNVAFDREGPDYGRVIDALTHGASSLIQQAYLRKLQERDMRLQAEDRQYQRSRDQAQDKREQEKFEHEKWMDRAELIAKGYHEEAHTIPSPSGAIARAMATPSFAPPPEGPPVVTQKAEPHYDLERNIQYRTSVDRATVAAQAAEARQNALIQARAQAQVRGEQIQQRLIRLRAEEARRSRAGRGNIPRAMTEGQRRQFAQEDAVGLLDTFGGSLDAAVEYLESPDGAPYRESGVTAALLANARARLTQRTAQGAMPFVRDEMPADSAVKVVEDVRKAAGGAPSPAGRLRPRPDSTAATKRDSAAPPAASARGMPKRTPDQAAQGAADLIRTKKATFAQAMQSRSLSDSAKAVLRKLLPEEAKKYDAGKK